MSMSAIGFPGSSGVGMAPVISPGAVLRSSVGKKLVDKGQRYATRGAGKGAAWIAGKLGAGRKKRKIASQVGRALVGGGIKQVRKVFGFKKGGKVRRYASGGRVRRSP